MGRVSDAGRLTLAQPHSSPPPLYRYRLLHRVLWGWLYYCQQRYTYQTPSLRVEVVRRRTRAELFSRLLIADREPECPRCLFARWLEYTQVEVAQRELVKLAIKLRIARLLAKCFHAFVTGLKAKHGAWSYPWLILNIHADLDKWACAFVRPELYSDWMRRRNRWLKRRAQRNASETVVRQEVMRMRAEVRARAAVERDLIFEYQGSQEGAIEVHWTGALQLREQLLIQLWQRAESLVMSTANGDEDEPRALMKGRVAFGLSLIHI